MKSRKFLFIALAIALPLALIVPLRAARSWQPREIKLPFRNSYVSATDHTQFFWRKSGIALLSDSFGNGDFSTKLNNWNGQNIPVRNLHGLRSTLDGEGKLVARWSFVGASKIPIQLWDVAQNRAREIANAQLSAQIRRNPKKLASLGDDALALSPDGTRLASTLAHPKAVQILDTRTGKLGRYFVIPARDAEERNASSHINALAYSPDGRQLAIVGGSRVWIIDANNGNLLHLWKSENIPNLRVAWSPDGKSLVLAGGHPALPTFYNSMPGGPSHFLSIYDVQSENVRFAWSGRAKSNRDSEGITSFSFSPGGQYLAWGTYAGNALIMNLRDHHIEREFPTPSAQSLTDSARYVAYAPDGNTLAVATREKITLWRIK